MGFYETCYLIRAVHFVPGIEGVTSSNVKKIHGKWYYIKFNKELEIGFNYNSSDLSDIIHTIDDNKVDNYKSYNVNFITENCALEGLKLDWYIFIDGFTTLDNSSYTNLIKITNKQCLLIDRETVKKFKKINKNNKVLEKMENILKEIEKLKSEYDQLKNTLID